MDDKVLRQHVIDELDWDPSLDAANIGVAVHLGVVTLTGHVPSYAEKLAAERAAQKVKGVRAVAQEIEVRAGDEVARTDDEIAAHVLTVLSWDVVLPKDAVKVKVSKGWVTLSGQVDWDYQRRAAEANVRKVRSVTGITNSIAIKACAAPGDVSQRIEAALRRDAAVEADNVRVVMQDGKITLEGTVNSWHERSVIERAAWAAPGVRAVEDRLTVR